MSFAYGYYDYFFLFLFASLLLEILRCSLLAKVRQAYCYGNLGRKWLLIQQKHSQKLSQQQQHNKKKT